MEDQINQQILLLAVQTAIFCNTKDCENVLDVATATYVEARRLGGAPGCSCLCPTCADKTIAFLAEHKDSFVDVEIIDGRKLGKELSKA
jgi:hypothetical protein